MDKSTSIHFPLPEIEPTHPVLYCFLKKIHSDFHLHNSLDPMTFLMLSSSSRGSSDEEDDEDEEVDEVEDDEDAEALAPSPSKGDEEEEEGSPAKGGKLRPDEWKSHPNSYPHRCQ